MKTSSLAALSIALAPAFAVPPENFGFPESDDDTPLSVIYRVNSTDQALQPGELFGIDVPEVAPTIAANESYKSLGSSYAGPYILFMLDPDASYPENPTNRWIIHWWQENVYKSNNTADVNSTDIGGTRLTYTDTPRVNYRQPRPPTNSSAHRYIQYLFRQPEAYTGPPEQYFAWGENNVLRFPFEDFVNDADLGDPVAANYFYCSNQTAVPALFVGEPGSEYPGGNGAMVTQGENEPTATSSTAANTASSTGTQTASGSAAATSSSGAANVLKVEHAPFAMAAAVGVSWFLL